MSQSCGQRLIEILESAGITDAFGIPGVHNLELYRGIAGSSIRHVTSRHEQGAAFMADGYARVTGRPALVLPISGPGLLKAYRALCALDDVSPRHAGPAEVAEAAARGDDAQAREALRMFCDVLGAALGDFVLASGATRVWVAGGILPKLRGFVADSDFEARFLEKGTMRKVLEQVPVRLVDDPQLGIIGAANWYLRHRSA